MSSPIYMLLFGQGFEPLLGYIDPGLLSMALQAFFVLIFGAATAFLFAPWRWFKSLFNRSKQAGTGESVEEVVDEQVSQSDGT